MKLHYRVTFLAIVLFPVFECMADVPSALDGKTTDGWTVAVAVDVSIPYVQIWKEGKESEKTVQIFKDEQCVYSEEATKSWYIPVLTCAATGKSPLAGTKYVGHSVHGNCEKGEPQFILKCVSGCDVNRRAPRTLSQSYGC